MSKKCRINLYLFPIWIFIWFDNGRSEDYIMISLIITKHILASNNLNSKLFEEEKDFLVCQKYYSTQLILWYQSERSSQLNIYNIMGFLLIHIYTSSSLSLSLLSTLGDSQNGIFSLLQNQTRPDRSVTSHLTDFT